MSVSSGGSVREGAGFRYETRGDGTIRITGFPGTAPRAAVPQEIAGQAVTCIGSRAFSGRQDVREIELPDGIREIGSFAFYNCGKLELLSMTDSVEDFGDGAIRMCPALSEIRLSMRRGYFRLVKDLVADSDAMLRLRLEMGDGTAGLIFPGFYSEVREDTRARAIHQSIVGSGYSYRQCVTRQGIDFEQYDECFSRIRDVDVLTAGAIALERIGFPYRLSDQAEEAYAGYLGRHAGLLLERLIGEGDAEGVRMLVRHAEVRREDLDAAVRQASADREAEITGLLMEKVRLQGQAGYGMETFSLEGL